MRLKKSKFSRSRKSKNYVPKIENPKMRVKKMEKKAAEAFYLGKNHQKSHKKHAPDHEKRTPEKSPYFAAGRLRRTVHISAANLMKVRRQNMSKKISPLRGEIIFVRRRGQVGTRIK